MSWIPVLLLAAMAFAVAVFAFRLERGMWMSLAAAIVFGLAGYAFQAQPGLSGAPTAQRVVPEQEQWASVDARKEMTGSIRSRSDRLLIADALARRGQFANAAALLRAATREDPGDAEAWLALGNVLVEHADGSLTPAALYAYRRAREAAPGSPAPGFFLGLALVREGALLDARGVWAEALAAADEDDAARPILAERLARLDALLVQAGAPAMQAAPPTGE